MKAERTTAEQTPIPAAAYVRMSTEHQQYSTENQLDTVREYAARRGLDIVRTFRDEGRSGLTIEGRDGLKELLALVTSGKADFRAILVYDVSRWGRFQNADESAYHEYLCQRAGIRIHYCAEQFENDGSPAATIVKAVKRTMAGEYSRELSGKVFQGQCRLIELGFRQGGSAGYGLRRLRLGADRTPKGELARGEQKGLQTDRVVLALGPPEEVELVRRIYRMFVTDRMTEATIARLLTAEGIVGEGGRPWTRGTVHEVLTNEKYIGNNVFYRTSFKLKRVRLKNPKEMWIRCDGAFPRLIDPPTFYIARGMILARHRKATDEDLLGHLKGLFDRHGRLSGLLIDETEGMPSSTSYRHRFGSLVRAYQLVGFTPDRDYTYLEVNRRLRRLHPEVVQGVVESLERLGARVERASGDDLLLVNGMTRVSVVLARHERTDAGGSRWHIHLDASLSPDLTIAVRMEASNEAALDYYLLPSIDFEDGRLSLAEDNGARLDGYRFDTLDYFFGMAELVSIEVAA